MMNPKNICISAVVGFILSFVIGLISHVGFMHIILRALIFAVVFAALYAGISFIYEKFLSDNTRGMDIGSDVGASVSQKPVAGSMINIVVGDSKLQDDDQSPKFFVGNNRPKLGAEDLAKENAGASPVAKSSGEQYSAAAASRSAEEENHPAPAPDASPVESKPAVSAPVSEEAVPDAASVAPADSSAAAAGFTPVGLDAVTKASDGGSGADSSDKNDGDAGGAEASLDSLPEINDLSLSKSGEKSEVISDSDFALGGGASSASSGDKSGGQDTNVMAQAIRTILAQDN